MTSEQEHYFTADPSVPFKRESLTVQAWGQQFSAVSGAGVFSRGHLDHGTAVLFRETEAPTSGHILDLGCGWGVIGLAAALASPRVTVTGVDVNERALLLATENAEQLAVSDRVSALLPEQVDPELRFDEIWSNPPIRIGKTALHELLLTWLPRLAPGGRAVMVVGKNLGADSLMKWLTDQGYPTTRIASAKGFRVLQSTVAP